MENLLQSLAGNYGLLGLLLALSILANVAQYRINQTLQEKRIADLKESRDTLLEPMKAIRQTVELILSMVQKKT